jgi:hypothetical protein
MGQTDKTANALRMGIYGAALTLIGILFSGPLGMMLVYAVHAQPPWQDARTFVDNYHAIQTFPFFAGFALAFGYVLLMTGIYHVSLHSQKTGSLVAVILTAVFASLIFFNYICQTTFVPALVRGYEPDCDPLIAAFSFSNPRSLCWAVEMWGYALLGIAMWFVAPVFNRNRLERVAKSLMIANGVVSIAGGIVAAYDLSWVLTLTGFICYEAWNVLVFVLSICIVISFRRRQIEAMRGE